jgi:hypothetical protein
MVSNLGRFHRGRDSTQTVYLKGLAVAAHSTFARLDRYDEVDEEYRCTHALLMTMT